MRILKYAGYLKVKVAVKSCGKGKGVLFQAIFLFF